MNAFAGDSQRHDRQKLRPNDTLLLYNARSVQYKWLYIVAALSFYNPDIVAITETWLNNDEYNYYKFHNYQQFVKCWHNDKDGVGGVMLLFNPAYKISELALSFSHPKSCDVIAVIDVLSSHCWVLVYRLPDTRVDDTRELFLCIEDILMSHNKLMLFGDFNMSLIDWRKIDNEDFDGLCAISFDFLETCSAWDLHRIVIEPTLGSSWLGLILMTCPDMYSKISVHPPLFKSDHDAAVGRLCSMSATNRNNRKVLDFSNADYTAMTQHMCLIDWPSIFVSCCSTNENWSMLYNVLQQTIHEYVPLKQVGFRKPSLLPKHLRKCMACKRKVWRCWKSISNSENETLFNEASRAFQKMIREFHLHEEDIILAGSQ